MSETGESNSGADRAVDDERRVSSTLGVIAFVFSMLICIPFASVVGLILGLIHLVRTRGGGPGRGFAVGAIAASSLYFVLAGLVIRSWSTPDYLEEKGLRDAVLETHLQSGSTRMVARLRTMTVACPRYGVDDTVEFDVDRPKDQRGTWTVARTGGQSIRLIDDPERRGWRAVRHTDGRIAYARYLTDGERSQVLVRELGGEDRVIMEWVGQDVTRIEWMDDEHLLVLANWRGAIQPFRVSLAGGEAEPFLELPSGQQTTVQDMDLGDTRALFVVADRLQLLDLETGEIDTLTTAQLCAGARMGGEWFFFANIGAPSLFSDTSGLKKLRQGALDGAGRPRVVFTAPSRLGCFDISDDGQFLLFVGAPPENGPSK